MKQLLFITLSITLFFASCETVELNELQDFQLTLKQESDTIIELSWTKANIHDFKKYIVVRSAEPITSTENPDNEFVLAEIDDFNQNSLTDIISTSSSDYYYKIYTELEGRNLSSNQGYIHFDKTYSLFIDNFIQTDQVQFTWNPTNISSFQRFIIAFSDAPISDNFTEIFDLDHEIIDERNINTTIYSTSDAFGLHFKFFIDLGDRIVSTESLTTIIPNSTVLNPVYTSIEHNPENNQIYFWKDDNNSQIKIFDYDQNMIVKSILAPSNIKFSADRNGSQTDLSMIDNGYKRISIYDINNLTFSHSFPIDNNSANAYDIKSTDNWVFLAMEQHTQSFLVYDKISQTKIYSNSLSTAVADKKLEILDHNNLDILELSMNAVHIYSLDTTPNLTAHKTANHSFTTLTDNIAVSPNKQYFAGLINGLIYHSSLNNSFLLPGNLTYNTFAFSENSDKIYGAVGGKIYKYDIATLSLEDEIDVRFFIRYIFIDDGQLIVIGYDNKINPQYTIISKIEI